MKKAIRVIVFVLMAHFGQYNSVFAARIYWAEEGPGKIQCANLDGSDRQELIAANGASSVAISADGGKIYWAEVGYGKIRRSNIDGSGIEDLITSGLGQIYGFTLDVVNKKMYWTEYDTCKIRRANLDGSGIEDVIANEPEEGVSGIALDIANGKMYWTEINHGKIRRANLDGSEMEDLITSGLLIGPAGIALDIFNGKMYWTEHEGRKIGRANLDGSGMEDLITSGLGQLGGIALDIANGKMYWTEYYNGKIGRANLDGSGMEGIVIGLWNPWGIVLDIVTTIAKHPSPADEAKYVSTDVALSWMPGQFVSDVNGHDVYFGTNFNDVNDANTIIAPMNVYMGRQDANTFETNIYDSNGLKFNQTYYWRIDEVNEPNTWIGNIWSFTVEPPSNILTINVEPNDMGINSLEPEIGQHSYYEMTFANINATRFVQCPNIRRFDHWEGQVSDPNSAQTTVFMDADKTVTAIFVDGAICGDECHPNFLMGDLNHDCIVDLKDLAMFSNRYLHCTKPECD